METDLIARARKGDSEAFRGLVSLHTDCVYRFCFRLVREPEEAADLTQEAFITAFRKLKLYRPTGAFRSWLFSIAYHQYLNLRVKKERHMQAAPILEEELAFTARLNAESESPGSDQQSAVQYALERMDETYRLPIILRYQEGHSPADIARALSITEIAVKNRLYRGKRLLAGALAFLLKTRKSYAM